MLHESKLRILVLGYMVRGPLGGLAWHHMQYVLGLARLGHEVYFLEDSDDFPSCYNPLKNEMGKDPAYGLQFTQRSLSRIGFGDRWAYYDAHTTRWLGPTATKISGLLPSADILLNVSGVNPLRPWFDNIPVRAFIDTDPVFTQIRHLTDPSALCCALQHTHFFTFGENMGKRTCTIPDDGFLWQDTRQPVVLDAWKVVLPPTKGKVTTVLQWDSYPAL